ncbi:hypothetical protein BB934_45495 (plasmid) [Microvirga ossetica]|uniref:Uncharacterized protein n=1 Tax=Microvirga ossetica TaxID=1882682 RepID=A0A1B2EZW8_9HYPH|nr:hypothetical protein [Microvirga ossetica]ANY85477.1 hypothetical protein BB934_45495 [Microvirga ossetica]
MGGEKSNNGMAPLNVVGLAYLGIACTFAVAAALPLTNTAIGLAHVGGLVGPETLERVQNPSSSTLIAVALALFAAMMTIGFRSVRSTLRNLPGNGWNADRMDAVQGLGPYFAFPISAATVFLIWKGVSFGVTFALGLGLLLACLAGVAGYCVLKDRGTGGRA